MMRVDPNGARMLEPRERATFRTKQGSDVLVALVPRVVLIVGALAVPVRAAAGPILSGLQITGYAQACDYQSVTDCVLNQLPPVDATGLFSAGVTVNANTSAARGQTTLSLSNNALHLVLEGSGNTQGNVLGVGQAGIVGGWFDEIVFDSAGQFQVGAIVSPRGPYELSGGSSYDFSVRFGVFNGGNSFYSAKQACFGCSFIESISAFPITGSPGQHAFLTVNFGGNVSGGPAAFASSGLARIDLAHTILLTILPITPGASFHSLSGIDYTQIEQAPDPTTPVPEAGTLSLLGAGVAWLLKRKGRTPLSRAAPTGTYAYESARKAGKKR